MTNPTVARTAKRYGGVVVPMVTPFTASGELDEPAVCRIIDHLIDGGVTGIFVLGTTGEEASMPPAMRAQLVAVAARHIAGRVLLYAGIGDNSFATTVEAAQTFRRAGAAVLVSRLPTYYYLSDAEQEQYFLALLNAIDGPVMFYNITNTTHMTLPLSLVESLSRNPKVVGIKDSDNNLPRLEALLSNLKDNQDFSIFVGFSGLAAWAIGLGADGCVPGPGNVTPNLYRRIYEAAFAGHDEAALAIQASAKEIAALINGPNPLAKTLGRTKAAMGAFNLCGPHVLPPLPTPSAEEQDSIRQALLAWQATQV